MLSDEPDRRRATPRICRDSLSDRPVFVAPQRGGKPDDEALASRFGDDLSGPSNWCPFCAGNERRTPADVGRVPADASLPWRARIVPNTYPITTGQPAAEAAAEDREAGGRHEVVIESPQHHGSILAIEADAWRDVWSLCRERLAIIADEDRHAWATIFKNSGRKAGSSLEHVHSQLVAVDIIPPVIRGELAALVNDTAVFPRLIAAARAGGRIVSERGGLVALVPPAPRQPYETWIVSEQPEPHLHTAAAEQGAALADLTRDFVGRLERLAPGSHFNWWLHQAPFARSAADARTSAGWHWHLEILPRLSEFAGFELGTGCHITTVSAEDSAQQLRDAGV